MGFTTFSGPILSGPISNTTGTTLGTDVANRGSVQLSRTSVVTQATNAGVAGLYKTLIVIPKTSQIITIRLYVQAVWSGGAATFNIGTSTTATELAVAGDAANTGAALGIINITAGANLARLNAWLNTGTSDVQIYMLSTNTGTGVGALQVEYIQARNYI